MQHTENLHTENLYKLEALQLLAMTNKMSNFLQALENINVDLLNTQKNAEEIFGAICSCDKKADLKKHLSLLNITDEKKIDDIFGEMLYRQITMAISSNQLDDLSQAFSKVNKANYAVFWLSPLKRASEVADLIQTKNTFASVRESYNKNASKINAAIQYQRLLDATIGLPETANLVKVNEDNIKKMLQQHNETTYADINKLLKKINTPGKKTGLDTQFKKIGIIYKDETELDRIFNEIEKKKNSGPASKPSEKPIEKEVKSSIEPAQSLESTTTNILSSMRANKLASQSTIIEKPSSQVEEDKQKIDDPLKETTLPLSEKEIKEINELLDSPVEINKLSSKPEISKAPKSDVNKELDDLIDSLKPVTTKSSKVTESPVDLEIKASTTSNILSGMSADKTKPVSQKDSSLQGEEDKQKLDISFGNNFESQFAKLTTSALRTQIDSNPEFTESLTVEDFKEFYAKNLPTIGLPPDAKTLGDSDAIKLGKTLHQLNEFMKNNSFKKISNKNNTKKLYEFGQHLKDLRSVLGKNHPLNESSQGVSNKEEYEKLRADVSGFEKYANEFILSDKKNILYKPQKRSVGQIKEIAGRLITESEEVVATPLGRDKADDYIKKCNDNINIINVILGRMLESPQSNQDDINTLKEERAALALQIDNIIRIRENKEVRTYTRGLRAEPITLAGDRENQLNTIANAFNAPSQNVLNSSGFGTVTSRERFVKSIELEENQFRVNPHRSHKLDTNSLKEFRKIHSDDKRQDREITYESKTGVGHIDGVYTGIIKYGDAPDWMSDEQMIELAGSFMEEVAAGLGPRDRGKIFELEDGVHERFAIAAHTYCKESHGRIPIPEMPEYVQKPDKKYTEKMRKHLLDPDVKMRIKESEYSITTSKEKQKIEKQVKKDEKKYFPGFKPG